MEFKKMFCIPYAGGLAGYYRKLSRYLDGQIQIHPIELKGRGTRKDERYYESFSEAVDDLYDVLIQNIEDTPFFLFGHSMGGRIAYELCLKLMKQKQKLPEHVFFSSVYPPFAGDDMSMKDMPDDELLKELVNLGGMADEFINNSSLIKYFLPIIKDDLRILDESELMEEPIDVNITVLWGNEDKQMEQMRGWEKMTERHCKFVEFEGGHFYINENLEKIADIVRNT